MKYFIGNIGFQTKKATYEYAKKKITKLGECIVYREKKEDYDFLYGLLCNHDEKLEKIGCGIDRFEIRRSEFGWKSLGTFIIRNDGSEIDFSWVYCCQFKRRSIITDLTNAMRYSIYDQTNDYKNNNELVCSYCKLDTKNKKDYHTDHDSPSFKIIKEDFLLDLESDDELYPVEFDGGFGNATCFRESDTEFKKKWQSYHKKKARYQILCATCNLKKKK